MTMAHDKADDLTAERAAAIKLYEKILSYSPDPETLNAGDDKDFEAIRHTLKQTRQEALREAITKIRQRGDEYMRDCEAKDASGKKYRDTYEMRRVNSGRAWAFKDLADELDRLASEGG